MIDIPRHSRALPSVPPDWQLVSANITLDRKLLVIFRDAAHRGHICSLNKTAWDVYTVMENCPAFPLMDRCADGTILIASSRRKPGQLNGAVIRPDHVVEPISCGDAIEHLQLDNTGNAWIGYFDEGVFGADQLSQRGLVRLGLEGTLLCDAGEPIDDCYALNVSEDRVLASWYSDFPIAECTLEMTERNRLPRAPYPIKRLAFFEDKLLLQEAYKDGQFHFGRWVPAGWEHEESLTAVELFGCGIGQQDRLIARSSQFHLINTDKWIWVDIADF
ncbi:hypothetical protein [Maricaulis sp.]|uniref:hypothetical protein n=1 Tax=Maricaulis sp. TaxID=1486257 RepID=UPI002626A167|nr:hypothetical protein [Maricaulis sp.]